MSYKQIKPTTLEELTMNVFMLVSSFDPATFDFQTGIAGSTILASTTGGVNFTDTPEYTDFGNDIDNCPKNCMELKRKDDGEVTVSGNLVTLNKQLVKMLIGAASIEGNKITPENDLKLSHFITELWGLADYGDGGLLAIKMKRVLNTSGFSVSTTDKSKAQLAFNFTCHKTIENQGDPPYEVYLLTPNSTYGSVLLNAHQITLAAGSTEALTATTIPTEQTVTWSSGSSSVATVTSGGVVTAEGAGNTIITASITVSGVTYTDTCTVVVPSAT